MIKRISI